MIASCSLFHNSESVRLKSVLICSAVHRLLMPYSSQYILYLAIYPRLKRVFSVFTYFKRLHRFCCRMFQQTAISCRPLTGTALQLRRRRPLLSKCSHLYLPQTTSDSGYVCCEFSCLVLCPLSFSYFATSHAINGTIEMHNA